MDDLGSRGSLVWLLLPAPHHQLTEEYRTGEVLEERERGREKSERGKERRRERERKGKMEERRKGEEKHRRKARGGSFFIH